MADDGSSKTTIVAETVTSSHVLEVKGYSVNKEHLGVGNGKGISSGVFSVGGHRWNLRYYPDGNIENANHISIFVVLNLQPKQPVATTADVKARICFSLLVNDAGGQTVVHTLPNLTHTFTSTALSWGYPRFLETKTLESSYLRDDDSFQIRCDLTVFKDVVVVTAAKDQDQDQALVSPAPPDLQRHLGNLLASKVGGDVEFEVGDGEHFTAHRYVLAARSSVFMAELFGPTMEAKETTTHPVHHVRVRDMEARVFRCMLHFIYTDLLPEIDDAGDKAVMAQHLLVAADRYDLQRLKVMCENMLRSSLDIGIAATTLVLAEQHDCQGLKDACFEFLKAPGNLKKVMAIDGFQHLKSSCPSLLEELLGQVAP